VALYARYSSENQRDASIEDQVRICRSRAEREGWTVVECFTDFALSGSSLQRPGYQALLTALRSGKVDVVLSESLDRLSRDQEHVAGFHKAAMFAGVRIVTLAEGDISELHVGLKGTMGALYLKDLADKTRRGLEGRVRAGRSGGGLCYGYRVVRGPVGRDGESERGLREVEPEQAKVVRRIFRDYGAGLSPKRIAHALNQEAIPGPRGGTWSPSAINGNRFKGTGILNNRLYIGELIWNRQRWLKDPGTGRRVARGNVEAVHVVEPVPELRIVSDAAWQAVKARQATLDLHASLDGTAALSGVGAPAPFWSRQRPRYLFSRLMRCGVCSGGFSKISAAHFGCSTARNQGKTACTNRLTLRHDRLEREVLGALQHRLMDPELFRVFVLEFTAEWNRLQAEVSSGQAALRQELERIERQLAKLVDALMEGVPAATVRERMATLEARKVTLQDELASAVAPAPRLHPGLAQLYRDRVAELTRLLAEDDAAEARELIRGLVKEIRVVPEAGVLRIEVRGALGAILALAEGAMQSGLGAAGGPQNAKPPDLVAGALGVQVKLDAGTRNRRSQYIAVAI
jgi:DNA invertase Pin-like site-specific DNA recombinase